MWKFEVEEMMPRSLGINLSGSDLIVVGELMIGLGIKEAHHHHRHHCDLHHHHHLCPRHQWRSWGCRTPTRCPLAWCFSGGPHPRALSDGMADLPNYGNPDRDLEQVSPSPCTLWIVCFLWRMFAFFFWFVVRCSRSIWWSNAWWYWQWSLQVGWRWRCPCGYSMPHVGTRANAGSVMDQNKNEHVTDQERN